MNKTKNGFTLIELLVVIAIIGTLAAVVFVAINPIEQIKRSTDAGRKNAAAQIYNAAQAYYTATGASANSFSTYPATLSNLQTSGDLKTTSYGYTVTICGNNGAVGSCASSCDSTSAAAACDNLVIAVPMTSDQSRTLAVGTGVTPCPLNQTYFVYYVSASTNGKSGMWCSNGSSLTPASLSSATLR